MTADIARTKIPRLLNEVMGYCDANPHKMTPFILSVAKWANSHKGFITEKQRLAIIKIHDSYGVWRWLCSLPKDNPLRRAAGVYDSPEETQ